MPLKRRDQLMVGISIVLAFCGTWLFGSQQSVAPEIESAQIAYMEGRFEDLWSEVARGSAELVLHGAHWSADMTPPPIFRKYFLPYFSRT